MEFHVFGGNGSYLFDITKDGQVYVKKAKLNYEDANIYHLDIQVKDLSDESILFVNGNVTIQLIDVNDPPVITDNHKREIMENSPQGTIVVPPIEVFDEDKGDVVSCSLGPKGEQNVFDITANCTIVLIGMVDFETATKHYVEVIATDKTGANDTKIIEIQVLNENDMEFDELLVNGVVRGEMSTKGDYLLEIIGAEFPPSLAEEVQVVYGNADINPFQFKATGCRIVNRTHIQCMGAVGWGSNIQWTVISDGMNVSSSFTTSHSPPEIMKIEGHGSRNAATTGGQIVNINGVNFGPSEAQHSLKVTYGATGTEFTAMDCSYQYDHSSVSCMTSPGAGSNLKWILEVGGLESKWVLMYK